jgi:hypothetical protein
MIGLCTGGGESGLVFGGRRCVPRLFFFNGMKTALTY